jgi:hypothetical protein
MDNVQLEFAGFFFSILFFGSENFEGFHVASESLASIYFSFDQIMKSLTIGPSVKTTTFLSWI